ncbi:response regulator transcription factor [Flavobacterium sp. 83]|uniref:response regulator transcription factor n=1 Tax=Flavobacterium sp. 83 TaxID=1131812 RepID=UPI000552B310|nr:response regulator [Flavobacterium sp. 83]
MAKILIIDDEARLRETICELLSYAGYDVLDAQDGMEGLEKVEEFIPDLILCDIMMPILDGYGFMEKHKISEYSNIPVIFLTARVELQDQEKGNALGIKGYLKKPFIFKELKNSIESQLVLAKNSK